MRNTSPSHFPRMLLTACTLLAAGTAHGDPRQMVLHNGAVFTADARHPWAQALLVEGSRIAAVGSDAQVLAAASERAVRYDLGGRTVIPGLNDAHVHVAGPVGVYLNAPDFVPGPGPSLADVVALVASGAQGTPAGTWLFAFIGTAVLDDPAADRFALDAVAPHHPVVLFAWSGHGMVLDTLALLTLQIGLQAPDPFAGAYERLPGQSTLSGVMHEYAEYDVRRRLYALATNQDLAAEYRAFVEQAVRLGYTSLQDMPVGITRQRALDILVAANLPLRVRSICFPLAPGESCEVLGPWARGGGDSLITVSGVKYVTDGTPVERRAFVTREYIDRPGWFGAFNFPSVDFAGFVEDAFGGPGRDQPLFHAVGDAAIGRVLDALEAAGPAPAWRARRPRIEHGDLLLGHDIDRVAALGAVIVQNATHLAITPVWAARYQPGIVAAMEPLATLLARGIPLALGTDGIGRPLSPFVDLMLATIHPTHPAEALTIEQAVTAYTLGSAYAEGAENSKGSLEPGKLADIAVLSQDIFHAPTFAIPATGSLLTIVGGEVVWDAGAIVAN